MLHLLSTTWYVINRIQIGLFVSTYANAFLGDLMTCLLYDKQMFRLQYKIALLKLSLKLYFTLLPFYKSSAKIKSSSERLSRQIRAAAYRNCSWRFLKFILNFRPKCESSHVIILCEKLCTYTYFSNEYVVS